MALGSEDMTLASVYLYIPVSSNFSLMVLIGLYHNLVADNKVKNSVLCFLLVWSSDVQIQVLV